ncbi:E3 ubiquitin-protein ligase rnf8 [Halocaridina rubra]|uniref:E3 ubiquitin-protein ligase CHFR n=1 Tax=Halocaridina rubra TaxID=373956 RepID=A0AAN8WG47_HALRR
MATPRPLFYLKRKNSPDETYAIIPFKRDEVVIGRSIGATFTIADGLISRTHAVFTRCGDQWSVVNHSTNGVFVNEESLPCNDMKEITVGDIIQFGKPANYVYRFGMKYPQGASSKNDLTKTAKKMKMDDSRSQCSSQISLRCEHANLEKMLKDSNLMQARLQEERNKLQTSLQEQKHKLEKQYHLEKEGLEKRFSAGNLAQQALLEEKELLSKRLENQVLELQILLEKEHNSLEEKLRYEEQQKIKLIAEKDEVLQKLEEMMILEKKMQEERQQLQEQLTTTENQKKELQKVVEEKESLIRTKEIEKNKAEQLTQEKQQLKEELEKVRLALREKEDQYTRIDTELRLKDIEMQNKKMIIESGVQEKMKAEMEKTTMQLEELQSEKTCLENQLKIAQNIDKDQVKSLQEVLTKLEAQKESLEAELACTAIATDNARKEVIENVSDVLEKEFQCPICSELFITAVMLGCSHTYCKYCIDQWKKTKKECPTCRSKITSETRSLVVDNFIEKIVSTLSDDMKTKRKEMVTERNQEMAVAAAAAASASTNQRGRRGPRGRRGRGLGRRTNAARSRNNQNQGFSGYPMPGPAPTSATASTSTSVPVHPFITDPVMAIEALLSGVDRISSPPRSSTETSDTSVHSDSSSVSGEEDSYYGGYGRCYSCGRRGHWAHGCPDRW